MNDIINQLYCAYCENHKDMFASDEDGELKLNLEQIDKALSNDLVDKLCEIQLADSLTRRELSAAVFPLQ